MEDQEFMMSKHYDWVGNFSTYDSFSSESYTENPSFNGQTQFLSSPNTFTISLGGLNNKEGILPRCDSVSYAATHTKKVSTAMIRNPIQAQDHVLAERRRREILTKRFISLSALLPNLKKMDKVSVLEDATNYIKELQERVKKLEVLSGVKRKDVQQLVMPVKILKLSSDSDTSSSSDVSNSGGNSCPYESTPEIEVRMSGSSVLVRIKCQNKSSSYVKVLTEMQKVDLSINSSSATAFSESTLLITIVAQMEDEFCITITDLVKKLQLAL